MRNWFICLSEVIGINNMIGLWTILPKMAEVARFVKWTTSGLKSISVFDQQKWINNIKIYWK